jgi:TonB family protein
MLAAGEVAACREESHDNKSDKSSGDEKVYVPGGDVKPPKVIHYVEPSFSSKSKEAYVEGTVKISTVVSVEGFATNLQIVNGLNAEEDRMAMDALKQWRFQPGTKAGQPVNVKVTVEIDFHLL